MATTDAAHAGTTALPPAGGIRTFARPSPREFTKNPLRLCVSVVRLSFFPAARCGSGRTVNVPRRLASRLPRAVPLSPLLAPVLAVAALLLMNAVGHGRVALSPYGNMFLLARVIYDGPGLTVLRRDCPEAGWRLCPYLDRLPPTSDGFLWDADSPVLLAGGHKAVSADADAIIRAALRAEPGRALRALWDNTLEQLVRFDSGDGLEAWPAQVDPRIEADFPPREREAYRNARQQREALAVPPPLAAMHRAVALAGIAAALLLLPRAWRLRREETGRAAAGFLAMALLTLPLSAAITGGLSMPHDRYQSRVAWLPACVALLGLPALFPRRRPHSPVVAGPWTDPCTPDRA